MFLVRSEILMVVKAQLPMAAKSRENLRVQIAAPVSCFRGLRASRLSFCAVAAFVILAFLVCLSPLSSNQAYAAKLTKQYKANIYQPQTQLKDAPLVVWGVNASSKSKLFNGAAPASTSTQRPQVVQVRIKASKNKAKAIKVYSADGKRAYRLDLLSFCKKVQSRAIPCLKIKSGDIKTAKALVKFCKKYGLKDAYVLSGLSTAKYVAKRTDSVRCVADCTGTKGYSSGQVSALVHKLNKAGVNTVLISQEAASKSTFDRFKLLASNVWVSMGNEPSCYSLNNALLAGADALVSGDYKASYAAYRLYSKSNSLLSYPGIVGHAGSNNQKAFKGNTLEAFSWAKGNNVDAVECDLSIKNGTLFVSHNAVSSSGISGALTFDKLLSVYENTDTVIYAELKMSSGLSSKQLKKVTAKYTKSLNRVISKHPKAKKNLVAISFSSRLLKALNTDKNLSWIPRVYIRNYQAASGGGFAKTMKVLESMNAQLDLNYCNVGGKLVRALKNRGAISGVWVPNSSNFDKNVTLGFHQITTDSSDRSTSYAAQFSLAGKLANARKLTVSKDPSGYVKLPDWSEVVLCRDRLGKDVTDDVSTSSSFGLVSLDGKLKSRSGAYSFDGSRALVCVAYAQTMKNGSQYTLYSEPFYIAAS